MDASLTILLWLAVFALIAVGLAGTVLPALPGVPMIFLGVWLAAWIDGYERIGGLTLTILGLLTAVAVAVDFIASALGARRVGASRQAITGSVLGSLIGIFFGLPGLLLGPFIGAVVGELSARGGLRQAAEVGVATWVGLLFGTLAKLALSLAMLFTFALAYFL
ncbi:MAG: DUF456 domain-containing protein [Gammaproteobacteria bacterium]